MLITSKVWICSLHEYPQRHIKRQKATYTTTQTAGIYFEVTCLVYISFLFLFLMFDKVWLDVCLDTWKQLHGVMNNEEKMIADNWLSRFHGTRFALWNNCCFHAMAPKAITPGFSLWAGNILSEAWQGSLCQTDSGCGLFPPASALGMRFARTDSGQVRKCIFCSQFFLPPCWQPCL